MSDPKEDAREQLREAILANLNAYGLPHSDLLGDYIVISCSVALNNDMTPTAAYYLTFSQDTMLPHIARGLIGEGLELLTTGERVERDDD